MSLKDWILAVGVVIALAGFVFVSVKKTPVIPPLGSVTSPELSSAYLSVNGQVHYFAHAKFTGISSSTCNFRSPTEASSTLVFASVGVSSTTGAATIWEVGQSKGPDATTTLIGTTATIAASTKGTFIASTTAAQGGVDGSNVFGPGYYLSVKQGGVQAGGVGGTCNAEWVVN